MSEEKKKKPGRPVQRQIYCVLASLQTSKGRIAHGDRIKLPKEEAERLVREGRAKDA